MPDNEWNSIYLDSADAHIKFAAREFHRASDCDVTDEQRAEFVAHVAHTVGYDLRRTIDIKRLVDAYIRRDTK